MYNARRMSSLLDLFYKGKEMNLYVTHSSPILSAAQLDDRLLIMTISSVSLMLSTALNEHKSGLEVQDSYKPEHPCNVWVRRTKGNYEWTERYFQALCLFYEQRFGRPNRYQSLHKLFLKGEFFLPVGGRQEFLNLAKDKKLGIDFTKEENVHTAYKKYLTARSKI